MSNPPPPSSFFSPNTTQSYSKATSQIPVHPGAFVPLTAAWWRALSPPVGNIYIFAGRHCYPAEQMFPERSALLIHTRPGDSHSPRSEGTRVEVVAPRTYKWITLNKHNPPRICMCNKSWVFFSWPTNGRPQTPCLFPIMFAQLDMALKSSVVLSVFHMLHCRDKTTEKKSCKNND